MTVSLVPSWKEAAEELKEEVKGNESVVLVKGSQAIKLHSLVKEFTK